MFSWNLDKKLVMTSFRKVEAGQPVCLLDSQNQAKQENGKVQATDMITFRCANEICENYFPLKVKIHGTKYISGVGWLDKNTYI